MIRNLAMPMSDLMPGAIVSGLVVAVLVRRQGRTVAFVLASAGVLLFVAVLLVTLFGNVPLNNEIQQWTASTLPPEWQASRDRWQSYHTLRTCASLVAMACVLASVLYTDQRR